MRNELELLCDDIILQLDARAMEAAMRFVTSKYTAEEKAIVFESVRSGLFDADVFVAYAKLAMGGKHPALQKSFFSFNLDSPSLSKSLNVTAAENDAMFQVQVALEENINNAIMADTPLNGNISPIVIKVITAFLSEKSITDLAKAFTLFSHLIASQNAAHEEICNNPAVVRLMQ